MQTIRVGQLVPGMILAQDVLIPRTGGNAPADEYSLDNGNDSPDQFL